MFLLSHPVLQHVTEPYIIRRIRDSGNILGFALARTRHVALNISQFNYTLGVYTSGSLRKNIIVKFGRARAHVSTVSLKHAAPGSLSPRDLAGTPSHARTHARNHTRDTHTSICTHSATTRATAWIYANAYAHVRRNVLTIQMHWRSCSRVGTDTHTFVPRSASFSHKTDVGEEGSWNIWIQVALIRHGAPQSAGSSKGSRFRIMFLRRNTSAMEQNDSPIGMERRQRRKDAKYSSLATGLRQQWHSPRWLYLRWAFISFFFLILDPKRRGASKGSDHSYYRIVFDYLLRVITYGHYLWVIKLSTVQQLLWKKNYDDEKKIIIVW